MFFDSFLAPQQQQAKIAFDTTPLSRLLLSSACIAKAVFLSDEQYGPILEVGYSRTDLVNRFEFGIHQETPFPDLVFGRPKAHVVDQAQVLLAYLSRIIVEKSPIGDFGQASFFDAQFFM
jgi:hypothetical protein